MRLDGLSGGGGGGVVTGDGVVSIGTTASASAAAAARAAALLASASAFLASASALLTSARGRGLDVAVLAAADLRNGSEPDVSALPWEEGFLWRGGRSLLCNLQDEWTQSVKDPMIVCND